MECERLFVYGTLRRGFPLHAHLMRLRAVFRGPAKVAGELFDLGRFPGARPAGGEGKWVHGELYQLRDTARDLAVLDDLEGFDPGAPQRSEFVRANAGVTLHDGQTCRAWIYWLGPAMIPARRMASGDYAQGREVSHG
jgi:gamma-glutamylcyclotransferase (GGCT)/AIG2-like uncharacterized protein YtfP